ncbi:MAG: 50S ribosomal protein L15 [Chloroflexi bacterium]|nr:50S ribosomal protein L15 [Chloroflexota bacterium]
MKLHDLQPDKGSRKKRTRVGRGISAGKGKTAGRGTKGAGARGRHARKGAYFEGGQLPLVRRLPFKRGFTNLFRIEHQEVKISQLATLAAGTVVTPELLKAQGWICNDQNPVVVLGNGDMKNALTVRAHRFTKSAQEKITQAGGTVEFLTLPVKGARLTIKRLSRAKLAKLMAQSQS